MKRYAREVFVEFNIDWLAGFFDGEGSIGVYPRNYSRDKKTRYYVLVVSLAQSGNIGKEICDRLKAVYGGTVYLGKSKTKPQWKWNISADIAANFLYSIKPYLHNKKEEAELGFLFQSINNKRSDSEEATEIANKIKQCKVDY